MKDIKSPALSFIKRHHLIPDNDIASFESLLQDYTVIATNLLKKYMKRFSLCFARQEDSQIIAIACFMSILFDIEKNRKRNLGSALLSSVGQIKQHSAGSYSQSYETQESQQQSDLFDLINKSPLTHFLKSELTHCPIGIGVKLVSIGCEDEHKTPVHPKNLVCNYP